MFTFSYHSTNCYFIRSSIEGRLLAIDAGWPCTLYEYARNMKSIGYGLNDIRWAIVTHFHMDHAGLVGEFIDRGITCYVFENQWVGIDAMEKMIEKNEKSYKRIDKQRLVDVSTGDSGELLARIGVCGHVRITDYHSQDSVTFVSDEGDAVIGDLPPPDQMMPDDIALKANWDVVRAMGAKTVYPGHASVFQLSDNEL